MNKISKTIAFAFALLLVAVPHMTLAAAPNTSGLAPWTWTQDTGGLATTTYFTASTMMASTTSWAQGLFTHGLPLIYIGIGVSVAIAVALLLSRSVRRLIRGVTRGRRR